MFSVFKFYRKLFVRFNRIVAVSQSTMTASKIRVVNITITGSDSFSKAYFKLYD